MIKTYRGFDAIEDEEDVLSLDLSAMELDHIPNEIFRFPNLIHLNLMQNRISSINPYISNLKRLQYLNLSYNGIEYIEYPLPDSIESLLLYACDLSHLNFGIFSNLKNFCTLNVANNPISSMSNCSDLRITNSLNLNNIEVYELPEFSGCFNSLKELKFSGNRKCEFPAWLFSLKRLKYLYMINDGMQTLSKQIRNLTNLTLLNLSKNNLQQLPDEIVNLKKLRLIDVSHNQLKSLPNLRQIPALARILLKDNQLEKFPAFLLDNPSIRFWELDYNPFVHEVRCN